MTEATVRRWVAAGMPVVDGGGRQGKELVAESAEAIAWLVSQRSSADAGEVVKARAAFLRSATEHRQEVIEDMRRDRQKRAQKLVDDVTAGVQALLKQAPAAAVGGLLAYLPTLEDRYKAQDVIARALWSIMNGVQIDGSGIVGRPDANNGDARR